MLDKLKEVSRRCFIFLSFAKIKDTDNQLAMQTDFRIYDFNQSWQPISF